MEGLDAACHNDLPPDRGQQGLFWNFANVCPFLKTGIHFDDLHVSAKI